MTTSLVDHMNPQQKAAVLHTEGPLLVMAGAGSGKTRVLTHRIAYLIKEKEVNPWNILAITFTNKAAKEMKNRLEDLLGNEAEGLWVSTFHSMCVRILRRDIEALGYHSNFTIIDPSEANTLMKRILKELNIDSEKFQPRAILNTISNAKNNLMTPEMFEAEAGENFYYKKVSDCYKKYQEALHENQSVDFDDLIMLTLELFEKHEDILEYYQRKFQYIHVDEYQDTNHAQYKLVNLLAKRFHNLCVVGDADQSIYGWRGADINNILDFKKDYPDATEIMLEQNYRSTSTILSAANQVIENNYGANDKVKRLWTEKESGELITYYRAENGNTEAIYVIKEIEEQTQFKGHKYKDIAILYRTNSQSRVIEENLMKANIPYTMIGGNKFYDRKEIKDVIAYLNVLANPNDSLSFERIINEPKRGIGAKTIEHLYQYATTFGYSLLEACEDLTLSSIKGKAATALENFAHMIKDIQSQMEHLTITEITQLVLEKSGYTDALRSQQNNEAYTRLENIDEFLNSTQTFDERVKEGKVEREENQSLLSAYLNDLSLVSDIEGDESEEDKVTLMTLHAAKGLEFPVVFIIGVEEGIFPSSRTIEDDKELEEERRLAYVGITRAEEKLYLTNAKQRMMYGRTQYNGASRFIDEIDSSLLQQEGEQGYGASFVASQPKKAQKSPYSHRGYRQPLQRVVDHKKETGADKENFSLGEHVLHKKWGEGVVMNIEGEGDQMELDVFFSSLGEKRRLLAKYAPITKK